MCVLVAVPAAWQNYLTQFQVAVHWQDDFTLSAPLYMSGRADNSWKNKSSSSNNMECQRCWCLEPFGWQNGRTTVAGQTKQN